MNEYKDDIVFLDQWLMIQLSGYGKLVMMVTMMMVMTHEL